MTHKDLINIAYQWVLKNASCGFAFREINAVTDSGEQPDVIGFGSWDHSVLIEVKISRSDFIADRKKPFRLDPQKGMGKFRFYCCPAGLIKVEELPDGWGLIYVSEKGKAMCIHGRIEQQRHLRTNATFTTRNREAETALMYSALRRLHIRNRIEEIYTLPPTPTP